MKPADASRIEVLENPSDPDAQVQRPGRPWAGVVTLAGWSSQRIGPFGRIPCVQQKAAGRLNKLVGSRQAVAY